MLVYDKAYMELKNKYLIPLTAYSVPYAQLRKTNIKDMILSKTTSVDIISDKEVVFYMDKDYLLKALLGEIELFYVRKVIQKADADYCRGGDLSANWNIVTNYYNAFFAGSLMLRLCYRGNLFYDNNSRRKLEQMISNVTGDVVKLDSNQYYEVYEETERYVLKLNRISNLGTHELVWQKMDALLDEMCILSKPNSDERMLLTAIKHINGKLSNTFPSQLRNRVNYQPVYGLEFIDKKLFPLNENINWVKCLLGFSNDTDDNQIACCMYAYTKFMEGFCTNLISEYYEIRGNENGILKKINSNRSKKIEKDKTFFFV